jgi:hypothetical protein
MEDRPSSYLIFAMLIIVPYLDVYFGMPKHNREYEMAMEKKYNQTWLIVRKDGKWVNI